MCTIQRCLNSGVQDTSRFGVEVRRYKEVSDLAQGYGARPSAYGAETRFNDLSS